jgi:hypothetical protein
MGGKQERRFACVPSVKPFFTFALISVASVLAVIELQSKAWTSQHGVRYKILKTF